MQTYLPGTYTLQILSSNITTPKLQKSYRYLMGSSLKILIFNLYYDVLKYNKIGQSVSLSSKAGTKGKRWDIDHRFQMKPALCSLCISVGI